MPNKTDISGGEQTGSGFQLSADASSFINSIKEVEDSLDHLADFAEKKMKAISGYFTEASKSVKLLNAPLAEALKNAVALENAITNTNKAKASNQKDEDDFNAKSIKGTKFFS